MKTDNIQQALEKAMALCSRSEKCRSEIDQKLATWGISSGSDREKILNRLIDDNFLNERRYASNYVTDKHRLNRWGKIKIRMMLKSKSIPEEIIKEALSGISDQDYIDLLREELKNKKRTTKSKNQFDMKGKLFRFAASKGYEYDLIYLVIDELE